MSKTVGLMIPNIFGVWFLLLPLIAIDSPLN